MPGSGPTKPQIRPENEQNKISSQSGEKRKIMCRKSTGGQKKSKSNSDTENQQHSSSSFDSDSFEPATPDSAMEPYEDYGKIIEKSLSDFPVYERPALDSNHQCSTNCNLWENQKSIKSSLKNLPTPLLVPHVLGWTRELRSRSTKKGNDTRTISNVAYITPCGKTVMNFRAAKQYLLRVGSQLPLSVFTFQKDVNILRYFRVERSKIQYFFEDLAAGQLEPYGRIPVFNCFAKKPPASFHYIKRSSLAESGRKLLKEWDIHPRGEGCSCKDGACSPNSGCLCFISDSVDDTIKQRQYFGDPEYHTKITECTALCGCGPNCNNKATTSTIPFPLVLYFYPDKGWGVRAGADIPSGAFISMYLGKITSDQDGKEGPASDMYLVGLDLWKLVGSDASQIEDLESPILNIDGNQYGNVGRFFNHSCNPNMFAQAVYKEYCDARYYDVAFFTSRNITAGEELTWDYKYKIGSIPGRSIPCRCGATNCKGRML